MRRITVAGALWLGISISFLGLPLAAAEPVSGTVVDQYGKGVAGASVEIGGQRATTDRAGRFTIDGLEDGKYKASVRAGDSSGGGSVEVAGGNLSPAALQITIKPKVEKFKGKVMDRDGEGQAGATVNVANCGTVITNNKGEFTIECEPGQYQVKVTAEGKPATQQGVTLANGRVSPDIVIY